MPRLLSSPPAQAVISTIRRQGPLAALTEEEWTEIRRALVWHQLDADERLFDVGAPAGSMYVVASGRLRAIDARGRTVGLLNAGEPAGEMGLIAEQPRMATVLAQRDSTLAELSPRSFERLAASNPRFVLALTRVLASRLLDREGGDRPALRGSVFGFVPTSSRIDVRPLVAAMAERLGRRRRVRVIGPADVDAALGPGASHAESGVARVSLGAWLMDAESTCDQLILCAPVADDTWARLVARQCDTVLLVGDAATPPGRGGSDEKSRVERRELVLLGTTGASRTATRRWLEAVECDFVHHVDPARATDLDRLGRFLANEAVCVAFSGGGTRVPAHLGVLKALEEAGIRIDLACGAGFGGIVAALTADGLDAAAVRGEFQRQFRPGGVFDFPSPAAPAVSGARLAGWLAGAFGERDLAELARPAFCTSSVLRTAEARVHQRGRASTALQASASLPGLFPPVEDGGDVLVDGLFTNNLPAESARQLAGGHVIAVNLVPRAGLRRGDVLHGLVPTYPSADPITALLVESSFLTSVGRAEGVRVWADVFIEPDVEAFGFVDPTSFEGTFDAGYRAAVKALDDPMRGAIS